MKTTSPLDFGLDEENVYKYAVFLPACTTICNVISVTRPTTGNHTDTVTTAVDSIAYFALKPTAKHQRLCLSGIGLSAPWHFSHHCHLPFYLGTPCLNHGISAIIVIYHSIYDCPVCTVAFQSSSSSTTLSGIALSAPWHFSHHCHLPLYHGIALSAPWHFSHHCHLPFYLGLPCLHHGISVIIVIYHSIWNRPVCTVAFQSSLSSTTLSGIALSASWHFSHNCHLSFFQCQ